MLSSKTVCHRKEKFIVKEFGICTEDYLDCALFLPPTSYSELTTQQKQFFNWLRRNLHGIDWDIGNYPYIYLTKNFKVFACGILVQYSTLRERKKLFFVRNAGIPCY